MTIHSPIYNISEPAAYAKRIFIHYTRLYFEKLGLTWDHDNQLEIEAAVDDIIQAAAATMKKGD